jgi:hypothetical protein
MLIVYGPPDGIDSHPKGPQAPAIETWMYRHIEGLGDNEFITFSDRTGRGDYRLAPGNAHWTGDSMPRLELKQSFPDRG